MVDSSPPHNLTLLPSHTSSSHRRRPLRSRTYTAFIQLISHCTTNSPPLKLQEPVREVEGSITQNKANPADVLCPLPIREGYKNTIVQEDSNEENKDDNAFQDGGFDGMQEPIAELNHAKLVTDGKQNPIAELNHAKLVTDGKQKPIAELDHANLVTDGEQETIAELRHVELVMDGKEETIAELHHSNFVRDGKPETISEVHQAKLVTDGKQETIAELHHAKLVTDDELEVAQSNSISVEDFLVAENLMADCTINNSNEQENLNGVLDIQMDGFGVDKDFCIDQFNDVFESCFGMDIESSKGWESQGNDSVLDGMSKDAEQELQLKEMELEKLIHHSGGVESSFRPYTDIEMEEGEISGEAGKSLDASSDDAASLEKRTTENMHASEHYCDDGELFCPDEDKGDPQHESFDQCVVNSGRNSPKMARKTSAGQMQDNHMETQRTGAIIPKVTPRGRIHQVNAAENQDPFTTGKGDGASTKKRKRGPSTREKKKEKKRIKRAENNRKLGVKRLKLQPVLKEKKIVYCRHYLQGRCHEGDKCKFSHDTIPLTKSQPCVHYARHSCMKGDDCPFDHQLSNYPCANFASNGFCNRGSECLFSHKIPAKSCTITPNVPKHNVMSAQPTPSRNHMDNYRILHQKVEAILSPASNSPAKGVELPPGKSVPRTGGKPPRGVSFLSNKGKSVIDTVKEKQDGSSTKKPGTVGIGETATLKVSSCISELNAASEGAAPREKPRGINFLSFGQPSMDNSSHKKFSNLFSNCNIGTGKSVMKEGNLIPQSSGILNVHRQTNESAAKSASVLSEKVNKTPQTVSQHVNFLSFNRSHLDDSISKETANLHFSKGDNSSNSDKDKASTSKLQHTIKSPPSLPLDGLWDQSTVGKHANLSSSFKKSLFSNTPSLVQKAVQSTLSFAAKLENDIRVGPSHHR